MKTTTYHVVRVNTPAHKHDTEAMDDMAFIIERGFFWKKSDTFHCPVGSPLIAMGSHGGRGLFLFGMVTGLWENEPKAGEYHKRIPVLWQPVIYKHEEEAVDEVAAMLPRFNPYFGSRDISAMQFAEAFSFIASGTVLPADYHWQSEAA